jgi:ComF family protein
MRIPGLCAVCRQWGLARVCQICVARFAPAATRCRRCAIRVVFDEHPCGACLRQPPPFDSALTAVDYLFPWAGLIAQLKFNEALDLCSVLTDLLSRAQRRRGLRLPDLLLPVPLGEERLRIRGFNQSWELARRLGKSLGCATDPRLLLRTRDTPHQLAVPPGQRHQNVQGAFAVEPLRRNALQGKSVALIDDVMTTGATVQELARVVRQSGASEVQVWVLARTPLPGSV